jgi:hypothetical protein
MENPILTANLDPHRSQHERSSVPISGQEHWTAHGRLWTLIENPDLTANLDPHRSYTLAFISDY